jgi:hypothetical protein
LLSSRGISTPSLPAQGEQRRSSIFNIPRDISLNGLTMLNVPYYTQDFVKGAVLVGALGLTYGLGRSTT